MKSQPTYDLHELQRIIPLASREILWEINRQVQEERLLHDVLSLQEILKQISKRLMELGPPFEKQKGLIRNIAQAPTYSTDFLRDAIPLSNLDQMQIISSVVTKEEGLYNLLEYAEILPLINSRLKELSVG